MGCDDDNFAVAYKAWREGRIIDGLGNTIRRKMSDSAAIVVKWSDVKRKRYGMPFGEIVSDSAAIVSGGLDSTVLVYDMIDRGYTPHMLSFNYGQRHNKELRFAEYTAKKLGLQHDIIDLSAIKRLISNSALTSNVTPTRVHPNGGDMGSEPVIEVPEGHYAEDTMKATVVPNRNMIMLSIAAGVAVNHNYSKIGIGVHGGDHFIYPDCRPGFISSMQTSIARANKGFGPFKEWNGTGSFDLLLAPFLNITKADIAYRGIELQVPFEETWSCYKGSDKHCGRCGTCVERLEAIDEAEVNMDREGYDKTVYEDSTFWREAIKNA